MDKNKDGRCCKPTYAIGDNDPEKRGQWRKPQNIRAFQHGAVNLFEGGLHGLNGEWQTINEKGNSNTLKCEHEGRAGNGLPAAAEESFRTHDDKEVESQYRGR